MTVVLAAIDDSAAALPVLHAAVAMARTIGAETRAIYVREGKHETVTAMARHANVAIDVVDGDPVDRIVELSADAAVTMVVIGARRHRGGRRPSGHVATAVMTEARKPVLVVPPDTRVPASERFQRVVIPLEGTEASADAVSEALDLLVRAGVGITVLHVFRPDTVPRFWDQMSHAGQSWGTEFLARWCDQPGAELHLRSGEVVTAILDVAAAESADIIALGWSQNTARERARVVRGIVARSDIPVLLTPTKV